LMCRWRMESQRQGGEDREKEKPKTSLLAQQLGRGGRKRARALIKKKERPPRWKRWAEEGRERDCYFVCAVKKMGKKRIAGSRRRTVRKKKEELQAQSLSRISFCAVSTRGNARERGKEGERGVANI